MNMTLDMIGTQARDINRANGWQLSERSDWPHGEKMTTGKAEKLLSNLMLITTEVAEAAEAVRENDFKNFAEELADVIIRVTSFATGLGIRLDDEVKAKLTVNAQRSHKHGGKAI